MASHQPFTLYSPDIVREQNVFVSAAELKAKLVAFYKLYRPKNAGHKVDRLLEVARTHGVLALERLIKRKYQVALDDADCTEVGWSRIYKKLQDFYLEYDRHTTKNISRVFSFVRENGLLDLDAKLKEKYGESLSEYMQRGLVGWKENWNSFLREHHSKSVSYELTRFYKFIESRNKSSGQTHPFQERVEWACNHSRLEVNEKLLGKYRFSLDDVKMIQGNTDEERIANLKFLLVEFYQKHDPEKLGTMESARSLQTNAESKQLAALDRQAAWGYIHLELLEEQLRNEYDASLFDGFSVELRQRLEKFYSSVGIDKSSESIERIIQFTNKRGLAALNEKLMLTYGKGIPLEGL